MSNARKAVLGALLVSGMSACGGASAAGPVKLECRFAGASDEPAMCEALRAELASALQTPVTSVATLNPAEKSDGAWISARFKVLPQGLISGAVSYSRSGKGGTISDMNMSVSDRAIRPSDASRLGKQIAARIQ